MKRTIVIGGGTYSHIRSHFSLASVAYGNTAKYLSKKIEGCELVLTKMADVNSAIETSKDLSTYIDKLLLDNSVGTIIFSCAVCDFDMEIADIPADSKAKRLSSSNNLHVVLSPAQKIIKKIRLTRPDIFLVGFKVSCGDNEDDQYYTALKSMKQNKCNLVLSNDIRTRLNMIITPEEASYCITKDRHKVLDKLVDMIEYRHRLTYNKTNLIKRDNVSFSSMPGTFKAVVKYLIDSGGFICDNGNNFTPGHFCVKIGEYIYSSQRKANHNLVESVGLTKLKFSYDNVTAYGRSKPSVGATSQKLLFDGYNEYDCIVHTHNPKNIQSNINTVEQEKFQCGSIECGKNTLNGMRSCEVGASVFLNKHGLVLMFKSSDDPLKIISYIKTNILLSEKIR